MANREWIAWGIGVTSQIHCGLTYGGLVYVLTRVGLLCANLSFVCDFTMVGNDREPSVLAVL